jgi:hypothetical protein
LDNSKSERNLNQLYNQSPNINIDKVFYLKKEKKFLNVNYAVFSKSSSVLNKLTYKLISENICLLNVIILFLFQVIFGAALLHNDLYANNENQYRYQAKNLAKIVFDNIDQDGYVDYFMINKIDKFDFLTKINFAKLRNEKLKRTKIEVEEVFLLSEGKSIDNIINFDVENTNKEKNKNENDISDVYFRDIKSRNQDNEKTVKFNFTEFEDNININKKLNNYCNINKDNDNNNKDNDNDNKDHI